MRCAVAPAIGAVVPPRPDRWHSQPTPTMGGVAIAGATLVGFVVGLPAAGRGRTSPRRGLPVLLAALAMCVRRHPRRPAAAVAARQAGGVARHRRLPGLRARRRRARRRAAVRRHAHRHGVVRRHVPRDEPARQHGRPGGGRRAHCRGVPRRAARGAARPGARAAARRAGRRPAGFLFWNRPPARLFMGDCGSLFIGALLGAASLVPVVRTPIAFVSPAVLVVLILVVPLFDTGFVLVLRRLAGRKATKGGTDHVSHRLVSLGFSERSAVRILYLVGLVGGVAAWADRHAARRRADAAARGRVRGAARCWSASTWRACRPTTPRTSSRSRSPRSRRSSRTSRSSGTPGRCCSISC